MRLHDATRVRRAPTVRSVVDSLRKAAVDSRVTSVVLRPTDNAALWGKVQEVRDAVVAFKRSKKPIVAYCACPAEQSSKSSARLLQQAGIKDARAMVGGYNAWLGAGYAVVKGDQPR